MQLVLGLYTFLLRVRYDGRHKTLVYLVSLCVPCARYCTSTHQDAATYFELVALRAHRTFTGIACFTFVAGALLRTEFARHVPLRDPGPG
jgi:hypothetical protein